MVHKKVTEVKNFPATQLLSRTYLASFPEQQTILVKDNRFGVQLFSLECATHYCLFSWMFFTVYCETVAVDQDFIETTMKF